MYCITKLEHIMGHTVLKAESPVLSGKLGGLLQLLPLEKADTLGPATLRQEGPGSLSLHSIRTTNGPVSGFSSYRCSRKK